MDDEKLFEMIAEDEPAADSLAVEGAPGRGLMALRSWQRFVLALLFFLDVAVIGVLVLVMLGRMQF